MWDRVTTRHSHCSTVQSKPMDGWDNLDKESFEMNVRTIMKKTATATAFAGMLAFAAACAHHDSTLNSDNDYGRVDQNQPATSASTGGSTTPMPGPVKVDSTGAAYTSSAAPGTGNSSAVGTNTNVQIIPKNSSGSSSVTYTEPQTAA